MAKNTTDKVKKPIFKKWWFWAIIIVLVVGIFGSGGKSDEEATPEATPETTTEQTQEASTDAITLTFGELGEYGTSEKLEQDGEVLKEYIAYRVPSGTYTVTNKGKNRTQVTVYKDGTSVNEDGNVEQNMSDTKPILLDANASDTLTINDGEYIEIYENDVIELVAQ